jgi:tRNA-dihydrouridine synthase
MIGRGIFGNPWLFNPEYGPGKRQPTQRQRLEALIEHSALFEQNFAGLKSFEIMKKHYKAYVSGFDGAAEIRAQLMECKSFEDVERIVRPLILNQ